MITDFKRFNLDTLKIIDKIVKGEVEHTTEMETFDTEMNLVINNVMCVFVNFRYSYDVDMDIIFNDKVLLCKQLKYCDKIIQILDKNKNICKIEYNFIKEIHHYPVKSLPYYTMKINMEIF